MTDGERIVAVGVDHTAASRTFREDIAEAWSAAVADVVADRAAFSGVGLRTCLRVEAYLVTGEPERCADAIANAVSARSGNPRGSLNMRLGLRTGRTAVGHLFSVAAGLESMIVGERQILDQVRDAWERARGLGPLDPRLDRLFQHAVATGKRVRRDTEIGRGGKPVAEAVADLVAASTTDLNAASVAIVGAGTVARAAAVAMGRRGLRTFTIVNRSHDRAAALAADLERRGWTCTAASWACRPEVAAAADVIVCATSAPGLVLHVRELTDGRQRLVVDLAVPRDVEAGAARLAGTRLVDLDAVWRRAPGRPVSASTEAAARGIVNGRVDAYMRWMAEREAGPAIAQLMRRRDAESSTDMRRALHDQTIELKRRAFDRAGLQLVPDASRR
jgi:glutamyl-tRNA reductase